jgi:ABC-type multidrug transport system ATPase subunit
MGLLIMDEFLKSLDPENHDLCIDMIDNMNVGCIMLSSHMETIGKFNNKSMNLALNDSGSTVINLTLE